jgi:hypothetical protein
MKRVLGLGVVVVLASIVLASCQTGVTMWGACSTGGDPTGTDGKYVLVCENGEWTPIMTVQEFIEIARGGHPTIGPLPTKPTPTTTSTTTTSTTLADVHQIDVDNMVQDTHTSIFGNAVFCNGADFITAQTITAGVTGQLDQVAIFAAPESDSAAPLDVSIEGVTEDGNPNGASIGSGSYSGEGSPDPGTPIDIPLAHPADVVSGHQYAVVFSTADTDECTAPEPVWDILGSPSSTYSGGVGLERIDVLPDTGTFQPIVPTGTPDLLLTTWVRAAG